ncbi:DNA primase, partial [Escherichia coli]
MKLAPNVKKQPRGIKHKETEVIIFAGSDAWAHAKQWQEQDGRFAGDDVPPVVLADEQLKDIGNLQIVPDGRKSARIYKAGHLDQVMVKGIGQKLAAAGVQDADYYPEGMHVQKVENWREYLARERQNLSEGLVVELPVKQKAQLSQMADSERAQMLAGR